MRIRQLDKDAGTVAWASEVNPTTICGRFHFTSKARDFTADDFMSFFRNDVESLDVLHLRWNPGRTVIRIRYNITTGDFQYGSLAHPIEEDAELSGAKMGWNGRLPNVGDHFGDPVNLDSDLVTCVQTAVNLSPQCRALQQDAWRQATEPLYHEMGSWPMNFKHSVPVRWVVDVCQLSEA